MNWEREKLILMIALVAMLCALFFILGIAAGASISIENLKDLFIPLLSMAGSWVAGIGSLGAVVVALWLAEKQRREDQEKLDIAFTFVLIPGVAVEVPILMVKATCKSLRPSIINSISLYPENASVAMAITKFDPLGDRLPKRLAYGESGTFLLEAGFENYVREFVREHAGGSARRLQLIVASSTQNFIHDLEPTMKDIFEKPVLSGDKKHTEKYV